MFLNKNKNIQSQLLFLKPLQLWKNLFLIVFTFLMAIELFFFIFEIVI